jgi:hypothetical protein
VCIGAQRNATHLRRNVPRGTLATVNKVSKEKSMIRIMITMVMFAFLAPLSIAQDDAAQVKAYGGDRQRGTFPEFVP